MNKKDEETIGVIKRIDSLGRIVIPKEFRERFLLDKNIEVLLTKEIKKQVDEYYADEWEVNSNG